MVKSTHMKSKINKLGIDIDQATDDCNIEALNGYLEEIETLTCKVKDDYCLAQLHFFTSNCYASIRQIKKEAYSWKWNSITFEKEIYYLRLSLAKCVKIPFEEDLTDLRFRVATNLANALNHVGRFVEALELWDEVIISCPKFAMAIVNRGEGLYWYASYLYDGGHQPLFLKESYRAIQSALELGLENHAVGGVLGWLGKLQSMGDWDNFEFEPKCESRGRSKLERKYRTWCLDNRLFLNPLNDLWAKDIAANDVLNFPSVILPASNDSSGIPEVFGIYNQLKQEYVSSRFMLFEAIEDSGKNIHFSDKRVKLCDTFDYRYYRLWVEKLKMAFLSAYTIFDKIGYLINQHWKLNLPAQKITFNSIWCKNADYRKGLHSEFEESDNWPLRGLYWVSKDLFFRKSEGRFIEPDARHLNHIRNHIAHKYLKVYSDMMVDTAEWRDKDGHNWSYPISDKELIKQTLKLMKLVRSALIYTSLAANKEETILRSKIDDGLLGTMQLQDVDDKYRL